MRLLSVPARWRRRRPSLAGLATAILVFLPHGADAQVLPTTLLDRLLAIETVNDGQATDLAGLRGALTALQTTSGDQANLLDLNVADLDALSLDVAGLRSTLGTIDVDILSLGRRDDEQDRSIADHERRITVNTTDIRTNTTDIRTNTTDIRANTVMLADHERRIAANTSDIADHDATLTRHERRIANTEAVTAVHTAEIAGLRTDTDANTRRLDGHDRDIAALRQRIGTEIDDMRSELDTANGRIERATEGVAMAFALTSPAVAAGKSFALSGGFGHFEGRSAFAVSGGVRASDSVQLDGGLAVGLDSGSVGGRAGATISW